MKVVVALVSIGVYSGLIFWAYILIEIEMPENLEGNFHQVMINIYHVADEYGYRPTYRRPSQR